MGTQKQNTSLEPSNLPTLYVSVVQPEICCCPAVGLRSYSGQLGKKGGGAILNKPIRRLPLVTLIFCFVFLVNNSINVMSAFVNLISFKYVLSLLLLLVK